VAGTKRAALAVPASAFGAFMQGVIVGKLAGMWLFVAGFGCGLALSKLVVHGFIPGWTM
jgi:hypothetical protein